MRGSTIVGTLAGAAVGVWVTVMADTGKQKETAAWHIESYKQGRKDALTMKGTNGQMNWELEQTCVALWAQNLPSGDDKK